ncbi:MAG: hypothetical protein ABR598_03235 [Candidatus Dormibacteria bacterium]
MPESTTRGLDGLLQSLSEQQSLRATGALSIGDDGRIYVVFGHALHAVAADATGTGAIDDIGRYARDHGDCTVSWTPGVTAGRAHTLAPGDGVLERLRRLSSHPGTAALEEERATERIDDLGLRRRMFQEPVPNPGGIETPAGGWAPLVSAVCELFEAALHRHARRLVDAVEAAEPEPDAILLALQRARGLTIRAVSRAQVAELLDSAEAMVRSRMEVQK